jgi:hypothetical protein
MTILRFAALVFLVSALAMGCSQKKEVANMPPLGVEGEDKDLSQTITSPEVIEVPAAPQPATQPISVEPMPEPVPIATPTESPKAISSALPEGIEGNKQIQLALKNANLYFGEIDGKVGPLTRKAVEEFQKMKGLKVDGKVGPMTWGELQKYLNIQPAATTPKTKR